MEKIDFLECAKVQTQRLKDILASVTRNTMFDNARPQVTASLVAAVQEINNAYKREKGSLTEDEREYLCAFAYLANCFRHEGTLSSVHYVVYGNNFPMRFPMNFGTLRLTWSEFPDNNAGRSSEAKYSHYQKYLMRKNVIPTLEKAIEILQANRAKSNQEILNS